MKTRAIHRYETQKYRSEASMEDMITLLEITASAVRRGALAGPLNWAVEHLGFEGAAVLYRDENDSVAMVSSAGDLGEVARKSGVLSMLATDHKLKHAAGTRVRQVSELGEKLLLATVGIDHVLVVRYAGQPPAIGDLRSVIAAVDAVLGSGRVLNPATSAVSTGQFRIEGVSEISSIRWRMLIEDRTSISRPWSSSTSPRPGGFSKSGSFGGRWPRVKASRPWPRNGSGCPGPVCSRR